MPKKLGLLIIHGMGTQKPDFAKPFIKKLEKTITREGGNTSEVAFQPIYWAPIIQGFEDTYWTAIKSKYRLRWKPVRKFVVDRFADATGYQHFPTRPNSTYKKVHRRIHENIVKLINKLGSNDKPIMILAHSLGGWMMSNYIWDIQKGTTGFGTSPIEKIKTLCGIITFGCNIPLFSFAYDPIKAIQFPPPNLPSNLKAIARWKNYFDRDDVLGYPLKPLSPSYDATVYKDYGINVGGPLTSWNPVAHSKYWKDRSFTETVGKYVSGILRVLR